jgi:hypothetical protein
MDICVLHFHDYHFNLKFNIVSPKAILNATEILVTLHYITHALPPADTFLTHL